MRDSRVPESPCPHCGKKLDGATDTSGTATPSPGDVMLCIDCGGIGEFGPDLLLQPLSEGRLAEVDLVALQKAHRFRVVYQKLKRCKVTPATPA